MNEGSDQVRVGEPPAQAPEAEAAPPPEPNPYDISWKWYFMFVAFVLGGVPLICLAISFAIQPQFTIEVLKARFFN